VTLLIVDKNLKMKILLMMVKIHLIMIQ